MVTQRKGAWRMLSMLFRNDFLSILTVWSEASNTYIGSGYFGNISSGAAARRKIRRRVCKLNNYWYYVFVGLRLLFWALRQKKGAIFRCYLRHAVVACLQDAKSTLVAHMNQDTEAQLKHDWVVERAKVLHVFQNEESGTVVITETVADIKKNVTLVLWRRWLLFRGKHWASLFYLRYADIWEFFSMEYSPSVNLFIVEKPWHGGPPQSISTSPVMCNSKL